MARKLSVFDADQILTCIEETLGVKIDREGQDVLTALIGWIAYNNMPYSVWDMITDAMENPMINNS